MQNSVGFGRFGRFFLKWEVLAVQGGSWVTLLWLWGELSFPLLLKPHQCSPQFFLTLRLLEALTASISDSGGVFPAPKKSFGVLSVLPNPALL